MALGLPYLHLAELLVSDLHAMKSMKKALNTEGYSSVQFKRLSIFIFFYKQLIMIELHTKNGYNRRLFQRVIFVILNAVKESE